MVKKIAFLVLISASFSAVRAQTKETVDTLPDYNALFNELAHFIDSLTAPWSFTTVNIGASINNFEYQTRRNTLQQQKHLLLTPAVGYYHKSGFGIGAVGSVIRANKDFSWYQTAVTGSYDYLKNRKLLTGISFTHFFTKDSLPFYVSPLDNETNAYFSYRGWWLRPTVAMAYGWGNTKSVEKQRQTIKVKKKKLYGTFVTETTESISDLSVTASLKHDFYWIKLLSKRDYFRVTPQVIVTGGTQRYGLEQVNSAYVSEKRNTAGVLFDTDKSLVSTHSRFQLLALSGRLRAEYVRGIFFVQPQLLFDYYVPEKDNNTVTTVVVNAGILF